MGLHPQFHTVGTFVNDQLNVGSSASPFRKTLLHGDTVLAQVITQMGRDSLRKHVIDDRQCTSGLRSSLALHQLSCAGPDRCTRGSIAERQDTIHNLRWAQTEKEIALAKCMAKKPRLALHAVTDEEGPLG